MSTPIGTAGLVRIAGTTDDKNRRVGFKANALATKYLGLNPEKWYGLFAVGAGPSDITVAVTSDSPQSIANGTAKYGALKTYTNMAAAGGFLGAVNGATGVKVTHVKNGAGVDDVNVVAALSGRFELRAVENVPDNDTGLGIYTALTST